VSLYSAVRLGLRCSYSDNFWNVRPHQCCACRIHGFRQPPTRGPCPCVVGASWRLPTSASAVQPETLSLSLPGLEPDERQQHQWSECAADRCHLSILQYRRVVGVVVQCRSSWPQVLVLQQFLERATTSVLCMSNSRVSSTTHSWPMPVCGRSKLAFAHIRFTPTLSK